MLIEDILVNRAAVTLFTRPRRFGKTLNMSMIKYFFDVRNKDENRKLFEGLKIFGSEYMKEQGKYPVIFVSLKDLRANTWEMYLWEIKKLISKIYREFQYITEKMNEDDKEIYDSIKNRKNDMDLNTSIELLSEYLFEYYGERVIILKMFHNLPFPLHKIFYQILFYLAYSLFLSYLQIQHTNQK